MPVTFSEKRVEEIWRDYLPGRTGLVTEENEPLEIIYPGSKSNDPGADFRDAIITTGKETLRGDVEIHVNSSNWREHGHHTDPNYNRVILHVVYRHDIESGTVLQNGCTIPTLALDKYIETPSRGNIAAVIAGNIPPAPRCSRVHQADILLIRQVLDAAGLQRFAFKTNCFRQEISREGVGQVLYRGIMTALGYSRNKESMNCLAGLVSLQSLEGVFQDGRTDKECLAYIQAKLLGAAGLLPSQRSVGEPEYNNGGWIDYLEKLYAASGRKAQMSVTDWHFFKVRPGNYPTRRIAAMSYLLLRYRRTGLLDGLSEIIRETEINQAAEKLEEALCIAAGERCGEHPVYGTMAGESTTALLGKERAADIVINVLLPFTAAIGQISKCPEEEEKAIEIFRNYPAAAQNMVVKNMRRKLGIAGNYIKTAQRQQGLLHIFKNYCLPEKCLTCPVSRAAAAV